ncbi:hypothetical protein ABT084_11760 [Streptomyces sp. NPDC002138]|uniref:hypothetical protein n=1 Tax=Streptomyces sp. NPDC002138 TaxID=3154410 RepID=UPI003321172B
MKLNIKSGVAAIRSSGRRLAAVTGVICSTAALLTAVGTVPAHAATCYNSQNLQPLGPSTPVTVSNRYGSTTIGYLYIGWDKTSLCSYAEIDWLNDSSGRNWSNNVSGDIYLNWNPPGHNSAEGKHHFNAGQANSWVSWFIYQGPGTGYTPGRSFTAAVDKMSILIAAPWGGFTTCTTGVRIGSTHDFSSGWNSGPGSVNCNY